MQFPQSNRNTSRRLLTRGGCLVCLFLIAALEPLTAEDTEIGPISVDKSFSADERDDLQLIAKDVWRLVRQRMPAAPPAGERPIRLIYRAEGPPLCDSTTNPKEYRIYLNSRDRRYAQFVYQLAHELGHVMLDARRTHGLAETLAEAISLQTLADMQADWTTAPPYPNWKAYAPEFGRYAAKTNRDRIKKFPPEIAQAVAKKQWDTIGLYLRSRLAEQDQRVTQRDLNGLAAIALLSGPVDWNEIVGLAGQTEPSPTRDPRFRSDLSVAPKDLPACCRRLGRQGTEILLAVDYRNSSPPIELETIARFDFTSGDHRRLLLQVEEFDNEAISTLGKQRGVLKIERLP